MPSALADLFEGLYSLPSAEADGNVKKSIFIKTSLDKKLIYYLL